MSPSTPSKRETARAYYIRRAIVRKTLGGESPLETSRMSDYALWAVLEQCLDEVAAALADKSDVEAAVAIQKARACEREIRLRGTQLSLTLA